MKSGGDRDVSELGVSQKSIHYHWGVVLGETERYLADTLRRLSLGMWRQWDGCCGSGNWKEDDFSTRAHTQVGEEGPSITKRLFCSITAGIARIMPVLFKWKRTIIYIGKTFILK